jgi:hypothetical protein
MQIAQSGPAPNFTAASSPDLMRRRTVGSEQRNSSATSKTLQVLAFMFGVGHDAYLRWELRDQALGGTRSSMVGIGRPF